jgi:hypothetical protein
LTNSSPNKAVAAVTRHKTSISGLIRNKHDKKFKNTKNCSEALFGYSEDLV